MRAREDRSITPPQYRYHQPAYPARGPVYSREPSYTREPSYPREPAYSRPDSRYHERYHRDSYSPDPNPLYYHRRGPSPYDYLPPSSYSRDVPLARRSPHHRPRSPSPCTADQLRDQRTYRRPTADMSTDYQAYVEATADLSRMTVDRLKRAIRGINSALTLHMRLSGKKNDFYNALLDTLAQEYNKQDKTRFHVCRRYINEAKLCSNPNGPTWNLPASTTATNGAAATATSNSGYGSNYGASASSSGYGQQNSNGYGGAASTSTSTSNAGYPQLGAYGARNSLPAPRFGNAPSYGTTSASWQAGNSASAATSAASTPAAAAAARNADEPPIRFRPSPFYRVDKALSQVATLIKAGQGDRKVATVKFTLTSAQLDLLRKAKESKSNPQYQVRLYCTSDTNYNSIRPQAHQFPAPIEFPAACEVKLNGLTVPANTKGIKKQPGTAPPVNLSGSKVPTIQTSGGSGYNSVDLIYTNTEKVYYIVAYLVEYTPIETIVNRVKAGKFRPKEEVIESIIKLNEDPDVEASAFGLSLKDPLSYARIDTPIRSVYCNHIACFDAVTWFEMNEQTPQWQCPVCSKTLKVEDMLVDGYFEDILKICSSAVDTVTVEPDGTWRSDNNKFGTAKPRPDPNASKSNSKRNSPEPGAGATSGPKSTAMRQSETLELDDSDDDDGDDDTPLVKRPRLNGYPSNGTVGSSSATPNGARTGTGTPLSGATGEVLDLTLSSDDEDDDAQPRAPVNANRPSMAMARTGSSEQKKGIEDVQRDIAAMNERMRRDYGENWRESFGLPATGGLPSPGPGQ